MTLHCGAVQSARGLACAIRATKTTTAAQSGAQDVQGAVGRRTRCVVKSEHAVMDSWRADAVAASA